MADPVRYPRDDSGGDPKRDPGTARALIMLSLYAAAAALAVGLRWPAAMTPDSVERPHCLSARSPGQPFNGAAPSCQM